MSRAGGVAAWWAAWAVGTLHACGTLGRSQGVCAGEAFFAGPITVRMPAS
jgi:hypothetical protein